MPARRIAQHIDVDMTDGLALVTDRAGGNKAKNLAEQITNQVGRIVLGKNREIKLALACMLAGGHLLIEDVPGVGKTLLARAMALALGLDFQRIQFTSDMLPADIIGVSIFDAKDSSFRFHRGPLFAELVLADEVNRSPPKSQSALLEAMEEQQITADGTTHQLPDPFFVIATQNPAHQIGTFPLPESQLDRFLMRIGLGYPAEPLERKLLRGEDRRGLLDDIHPVTTHLEILELQTTAKNVHVSDAILDYLQALVRFTRQAPEFALGLSPRGSVDLMNAARCWAMLNGHDGIRPEDLKNVFPAVAGHRLQVRDDASHSSEDAAALVLDAVPVP